MIYLLYGENEFLKRQRLAEVLAGAENVERLDGEEVDLAALLDIFRGQTLFSDVRTVVISGLSESLVWQDLSDIVTETDTKIILLEQKVDKRTKTYKWLQKNAKSEEFAAWGERDAQKAVDWCVQRAKEFHGFELKLKLAQTLVDRLGYDQFRLDGVLAQLSLADEVDEKLIDAMVPLAKSESVFGLLGAALEGGRQAVHDIVAYLEADSGPDGAYMTLGLLASQLVVLNGLVFGGDSTGVARDFSANPYVVKKLVPYAHKINTEQIRKMNAAFGAADMNMKTTGVSPWLLVEAALVEVSVILGK